MTGPDWLCSGCTEVFSSVITSVDGRCPICVDAAAPLDLRRQRGARVASAPGEFFENAGVPVRFRRFLSRDDWARHFGRAVPAKCGEASWTGGQLLLWGPTGTGKTGLSIVLLLERAQLGDRCWFVSSAEFIHRLKQEFEEPHRRLFDRAVAVEALVIDDVFANRGPVDQRPTPWQVSILGDLIGARWQERRHTIITSNWSPFDLSIVAPSSASRLCEDDATVSFKDLADRRLQ